MTKKLRRLSSKDFRTLADAYRKNHTPKVSYTKIHPESNSYRSEVIVE